MTIANNPATALEQVLRRVIQSSGKTIGEGWQKALGVDPGTPEFIQRHTEVVGLLARVNDYLLALDDGATEREIYLKYVPAWYEAVVYRESWANTQHPANKAVRSETLDHLRGLGANLSMRSTEPTLTEGKLSELTNSLAEWRNLLDEAGLPAELAQQIRTQVDHIEWLLANVETFGVEPVARGARELFGMSLPVVAMGGNWTRKVAGAMVGLVLFLTPVDKATEHVDNILTNLSHTTQVIEHFGEPEPQKAITAGTDDQATAEETPSE
ncbi:hypothetical protein L5I01_21985 [Gordonia sp. HY442]|uniref:hypothetical protein n=1 Tax=Gordonia zhenghanii TaxID=2911516 RepID=UPI001F447466|nr:hypothetical protein [Gordonia zhenghanii]MCF8606026.1 hypothetical protein [Gordonia zhenghanii]